ncbi:MAG TPA: hypothetical protein DDW62_10345 [Marinilabiliaceae bacterium]|nr:hypothetical protein [Marinilabiliaceae bacterium]
MGKILTTLLFLSLSVSAFAQGDNSLRQMKNWQIKGLAKSALRIDDPFQAGLYLEEWHRRKPGDNKASLELAKVYLQIREYEKAASLLDKLYRQNPRQNLEARYYMAVVNKYFGKYEEALEHFEYVRLKHKRIPDRLINRKRIEREIEGCMMGIAAKDTTLNTEVFRLNESVNHSDMSFSPIIINDSSFIYGSTDTDKTFVELSEAYKPSWKFFKAEKREGKWTGQLESSAPFKNSELYDTGRGALSPDGKRFYSTQCFINDKGKRICHIYVSFLEEGEWSEPQALDKTINNSRFTSSQPAAANLFNPSLEVLYFVSDRPGGAGGKDIWFSVYDKNTNKYQKPENAGVFINTEGDEISPYYDASSGHLYFSSNSWPGYGGFDIFYAKGSMVSWDQPVNIGPPVNSPFDDFDYVKSGTSRFRLFVTNRPDKGEYSEGVPPDRIYGYDEDRAPGATMQDR